MFVNSTFSRIRASFLALSRYLSAIGQRSPTTGPFSFLRSTVSSPADAISSRAGLAQVLWPLCQSRAQGTASAAAGTRRAKSRVSGQGVPGLHV